MKLSTKTLLYFVGVILFQASLTVSVLSYFTHQQNQETAEKEMREESQRVFANYNEWKTQMWKALLTLQKSQDVFYSLLSNGPPNGEAFPLQQITKHIHRLLVTSGMDHLVVRQGNELTIRELSNNKVLFFELQDKLPLARASSPRLENQVLNGHLTLTGGLRLTISSDTIIDVFLIKVIDTSFVNSLAENREASILFYVEDLFPHAEVQGDSIASYIAFKELKHVFNLFNDLVINGSHYNGLVRRIGTLHSPLGNKRMFLVTLLSDAPFASRLRLINELTLSIFILGSLLAIVLAFYFSRHITHPTRKLLEAMQQTQTGRFTPPIKVNASYEITELFQGFNEMVKNLSHQKVTMDKYVHQIELLKDYNERIIDSISTGIVCINQYFKIEKVNEGFVETFHTSAENLIGKDVRTLELDILEGPIQEKIQEILSHQSSTFSLSKRFPPNQVYEIKLYPFPDSMSDSDQAMGCVLLISNVSEKVNLEEKIFRAEKLASLSMLSAGVAHEINNPLNSITSNVQNLLFDEKDVEKKTALHWIEKESFRIAGIIQRLLNFASHRQSSTEGSNVNEVILQVIQLLEDSLKNEVAIETELAPSLPTAIIPQDDLKQVFLNLINNSLYACQGQGTVKIQTTYSPQEQAIVLTVIDSGSGIAEEILPHIFDPFYTTKPISEGTGLGLSVVYGMVKKLNGNIHVESQPNVGTRFDITFPPL